MNKKKILISLGIILFLIVIALILIWYYQFRPIELELVPPTEISPVKIPPSAFIEHISELPDGGGIIYGQAEPQNLMSEKQIFQKVIPPNTFVDHVSDFPGAGGTGIYPPVPKIPTGPIIPVSTFIKHIDEFPN